MNIKEQQGESLMLIVESAVRFHMEDDKTSIQINGFVQSALGEYRLARLWAE